jgi:hypothetical protein
LFRYRTNDIDDRFNFPAFCFQLSNILGGVIYRTCNGVNIVNSMRNNTLTCFCFATDFIERL